ncbi:MAG: ABC transporter permease [Acidobacteria bacterium]|nr:MAG: ABC transporter permease [Acidobacteriota bacterium]
MWASLKTATWLGWQIESNWASPALFALYSIVKPLTSAAILVVMFGIVTEGNFGSTAFSYMYIGNAFYMYVGAVMAGMAQAVVDDRERFRTLKSMYVAPVNIPMYLMGRGVARFLTTTLSVAITLAFGVAFLQLQVSPSTVRWGLFLPALVVGIAMLATLGLTLASIVLVIAHNSWLVGEAVAAALYLFCGAVFPLEVLPWWVRPVGYLMPVTYWLEAVRRSLVGGVATEYPTLASIGDVQLLVLLGVLTVGSGAIAAATFSRCDRLARERGLIDRTTNY